jgi:signal transduction histidine kinase
LRIFRFKRYNRSTTFHFCQAANYPMRNTTFPNRQVTDLLLSLLVLLILVLFTYGILYREPYVGFDFVPGDGRVLRIYVRQEASLETNDILVKAGDVLFADYKNDARQPLFENIETGKILEIVVIRDGLKLTVPWRVPGFNEKEFNGRVFNIWWLAYIFWFFGSLGQLLIRPRDERSRLFIAANYLIALWVIFGSFSSTHLWESSILLHVFTWLLLPVLLHLNWIFPRPFGALPRKAWGILYTICAIFALAEFVQVPPRELYAFAFLVALVGSIALGIAHYLKQTDQRRDLSLLAFSTFIASLPSVALSIFTIIGPIPMVAPAGLLALPFMPLGYFYIIYRRQLGGLEMRANRIFSLYAYMIIFGTAVILYVTYLGSLKVTAERAYFLGSLYTIATTFIAIAAFPAFESFVNRNLFNIKLPYQNLQEIYSSRISTTTSMSSLLQILEEEVFPSLLVRQYAFIQVSNGELNILAGKSIDVKQLSSKCNIEELTALAVTFFPNDFPCGWIRLILPLKAGDRSIGFWLLGQRDPDDHYPQAEILILQSLANQTAVALSNIEHAEQVRKMYQSDIERNEKERMWLAMELHDSVLNELAILNNSLVEANPPPQFQTSYDEVTRRLREIVSNLRPPMLTYGLVPAINELADNLMERNGDKVSIEVNILEGDGRLPQNMEQHLFRIVQEACGNSLRHAKAGNIHITGEIDSNIVSLDIVDDGKGFKPQSELGHLIANRHFGLAGMMERARLIGAEINIKSNPDRGTRIHIEWMDRTGQESIQFM